MPEEERGYHASGHAPYDHLLKMVREIRPRTLVPVHTEHPERFARDLPRDDIRVHVPSSGVPLDLG